MADPRILRFSRGPADRDPMFIGTWVAPGDSLTQVTVPSAIPTIIIAEPPEAPMTDEMKKWKTMVDVADAVIATLREEFPDLDNELLLEVIRDIIQNNLSTKDIAAIYRHRIGEKSIG